MRGPQVCSLAGQWRLCRLNGCDYGPEGVLGGWWCGDSLGLCANEEALIMVMCPLLSQMPLSLSPWPPSFKLQILIQIRRSATATRTSCRKFPCGVKCQLSPSPPPGSDHRTNNWDTNKITIDSWHQIVQSVLSRKFATSSLHILVQNVLSVSFLHHQLYFALTLWSF